MIMESSIATQFIAIPHIFPYSINMPITHSISHLPIHPLTQPLEPTHSSNETYLLNI